MRERAPKKTQVRINQSSVQIMPQSCVAFVISSPIVIDQSPCCQTVAVTIRIGGAPHNINALEFINQTLLTV